MPDPQLEILSGELSKYTAPEDRLRIKQFYVDQVEAKSPPSEALIKLREAGDFLG